jgi:hypothetical protein
VQHFYEVDYSFIVITLELTPNVPETIEFTFAFPVTHENLDTLFVPTLTRRQSKSGTTDHECVVVSGRGVVIERAHTHQVAQYSVNTSRTAGVSADEACRRRHRRLSAAAAEGAQHDALLARTRHVTLDVARLPLRLVEVAEIRKLRVR